MTVTYQYYTEKKNRKPRMSKELKALLEKAANGHKWHIVDCGTVGDENHRLKNPDSFHLHEPPDAIDIQKIYEDNKLLYDCRVMAQRALLAARIVEFGGAVAHARDRKKHHLHVQIIDNSTEK